MRIVSSIAMGLVLLGWAVPSPAQSIVDDAEYYALKTQHADKWAAEDQQLEQKLAELRAKNGGKPPNRLRKKNSCNWVR